jgi:hypothetical protein
VAVALPGDADGIPSASRHTLCLRVFWHGKRRWFTIGQVSRPEAEAKSDYKVNVHPGRPG